MRQRKFISRAQDTAAHGSRVCGRTALYALTLALCSTPVLAQDASDPIDVCSRLTDTSKRLACFDDLAAKRRAAVHASAGSAQAPHVTNETSGAAAAVVPSHAPPARPAEDTTGLDAEQIRMRHRKEGIPVEPKKVVVSRVARLEAEPSHHYHLELENGQVWASTDAASDLILTAHESVQIRPGILGAYFLKTEDGNTMRVFRIR